MTTPSTQFIEAFGKFVEASQKIIDKHWEAMGFTYAMPPLLVIDYKTRFVAVYRRDRSLDGTVSKSGSIHCFVDLTGGTVQKLHSDVGDIYKPANYSAPTKHARGNIFSPDFGASCMDEHGPRYLRGG